MIRLQLLIEEVWAEHPLGIRVHLRRLTTRHFERARTRAAAEVAKVRDGGWVLAEYGIPQTVGGERLNVADPFQMAGLGALLVSVECALLGVIAWEGVLDGNGRPVPVDRRWLTEFLQYDGLRRWLEDEIEGAARIVTTEGNVFGSSASGSSPSPASVGDPTSAETAAPSATLATSAAETPAASAAPPTSTRPRRKKGSGSGASSSGSGPGAAAD